MDRYKSECYILRHSYSSQKESAYTQVSEFRIFHNGSFLNKNLLKKMASVFGKTVVF